MTNRRNFLKQLGLFTILVPTAGHSIWQVRRRSLYMHEFQSPHFHFVPSFLDFLAAGNGSSKNDALILAEIVLGPIKWEVSENEFIAQRLS